MPDALLIETIQEGGTLSPEECRKILAGHSKHPLVKACLSLVETHIAISRNDSEVRGQATQLRDEACGGAIYLRALREEIKNLVDAPPAPLDDA